MKRKIWGIVLLCLVGLIGFAATTVTTTYFTGGLKVGPSKAKNQPYLFQVENPTGTTQFSIDNSGRLNQDDIVVIDAVSKLTSFQGDTAGTSVYRMLWGKRYIVDPVAIATSGAGMTASGMTGIQAFTGVSMILPYATSSNSMYQTSSVEMRMTGVTGYGDVFAGATKVTVWAPVNPGSTRYAVDGGKAVSGASYQPVAVRVATSAGPFFRSAANGVLTSLTSGGSIWGINKPGESITFEYVDASGVSIVVKSANIFDFAAE